MMTNDILINLIFNRNLNLEPCNYNKYIINGFNYKHFNFLKALYSFNQQRKIIASYEYYIYCNCIDCYNE